jgi:hypothetical protein
VKFITGIWQDARGNLAQWGKLHLKLNQDAVVKNTNQVAPREVSFALTQQGALKSDARVWANDELSPDGTYYTATVTAFGGGLIWGPQWIIISGPDPVNINALLPILTIPPTDQAASISIVTSPTLVGGALGATITGPNGVSTDLVTVSDQLILAGGSNISLSGSLSQNSLTLSINGIPGLSAGAINGAAGTDTVTVSNQLILAAGSNITLSYSTTAGSMTCSIIGERLRSVSLVPGANVSIIQNFNSLGTTATISAGGGGGGGGSAGIPLVTMVGFGPGGSTAGQQSLADISTLGFFAASNIALSLFDNGPGVAQVWIGARDQTSLRAQMSLIPGANIGITQTTNISGTTATITGSPMGHVSFVASDNIGITQATNSVGTTATISANAAGFIAGAGAATVSNRLQLAMGGMGSTFTTATDSAGMTVSLPNPQFNYLAASTVGGSAAGPNSPQPIGALQLRAGQNVSFSGNVTVSSSANLTINVPRLEVTAGSNITMTTASSVSPFGTTVTIDAIQQGWVLTLDHLSGGATLGTSILGIQPFLGLWAGSGVTLSADQPVAGFGNLTINVAGVAAAMESIRSLSDLCVSLSGSLVDLRRRLGS